MKNKIKEIYLLLLIIIGLSFLGVYTSYGLFTSSSNDLSSINLNTDLIYEFDVNSNQILTLDAGTTIYFKMIINNNSGTDIYYEIYSDNISSEVTIAEVVPNISVGTAPNTSGNLNNGERKEIPIIIINNSNGTSNIKVGVASGYVSPIVYGTGTYPSGVSRITAVYDQSNVPSAYCSGGTPIDTSDCITVEEDGDLKTYCLVSEESAGDTSGANAPILSGNMIPIKWDGSAWVKADINNPSSNPWYNYDDKMWANAVTVVGSKLLTYKNADVGDVVQETDILTYLVWVPRYSYSIASTSIGADNPSEIEIEFEGRYTTKSEGTAQNGSLYTHPAFTFDDVELSGIWVSKFLTTGSISNIRSKPNLAAVRNASVSEMFNATRAMTNTDNIYSFPTTGVDTHMIKNSEWGAVAYLSHSKYGQNARVVKNNCSAILTGCAGNTVNEPAVATCQNEYHTELGVKASTTGTIYGIYDMAGGAWEYVMGNFNDTESNSGFDNTWFSANTKYYNKYLTSSSSGVYNSGTKGDALYETYSWYGGAATFATLSVPWFIRGGYYNSGSPVIFAYSGQDGALLGDRSWRFVVIAEQ